MNVTFLARRQINAAAWDDCVAGACNALVYGHSWYLDAVTNVPGWRWEGAVLTDELGGYVAVLPVPLRRRWGRWVVYQPLFCQFLAVFSAEPVDPAPFVRAVVARYRYGSAWHLLLGEPLAGLPATVRQQVRYTHVLSLDELPRYTADRRMNLRRAARLTADVPGWQLTDDTDVEPLLALFRDNHAAEIGVGTWAYGLFRKVAGELQRRGLARLRYAWVNGQIVAGAFFVTQHGRTIYLFNAASADGRRLNARSMLLDEQIRHDHKKTPAEAATGTLPPRPVFDFESPAKPGVVSFYKSFGATPQPYVVLSWNRLTTVEKLVQAVRRRING